MPLKKADPVKHCLHCKQLLTRKRFNGRCEDMAVFLRRKFCGRECMAKSMIQPVVSRQGYLCRARKHRKDMCDLCGGKDGLSINHKNRDWTDNSPGNLETLCISCHMKKHWAEPGRLYDVPKSPPCEVCGKVEARSHHGMCQKHWQRVKRHGDPHLVKRGSRLVRMDD